MTKKIDNNECFPYNPDRDIAPVDQFGFLDLRDAYVNHSLPGSLESTEESYNGVEEPDSLLGKSSDVFDALRKANYVKSAESAAKAKAEAASSAETE